ncbi:caspase-1 [Echinops telfairi]|uniref:Caspase-1 n=2 Tax=Echinops telfairi TaxID=9371 RepID=A0AC55DPP6_ECHTE|nr:caspase-1 [Echinops telfairi]XP_045153719.1 caspase-1 [Echinops telfairi]
MEDKVLKGKRTLFIQAVNKGTINGLLDELLENKVLSQEEMETIRDENPTVMNKARALIDSVIKKGPQACKVWIFHLCEIDPHLAEKLELSPGSQSRSDSSQVVPMAAPFLQVSQTVPSNPAELNFSGPGGILKLCPPETAQRIWNEKSAEIYPIREKSTRTRLALIICNTEFECLPKRAGADVDIKGMIMLLQGLGYSVHLKENLTAPDMIAELKAFATRKEHETSDSTFVVFMSHGIQNGICGTKYSEGISDALEVNTIFQMLNTKNCPHLKDKPKVIIIQACRGGNQGEVWVKDSAGLSADISSLDPSEFEDDAIKKAHVEKDFIAFCSSTPENVSWRHPLLGSVFIMKLIQHLQEYACSFDLETIFRKVRFSFEAPNGSRIQMPTTERVTLTKCFYLFPGH